MKKYRVEIKAVEYGWIEVEAKNIEDAKEKALEQSESGNTTWTSRRENTFNIEEQEGAI